MQDITKQYEIIFLAKLVYLFFDENKRQLVYAINVYNDACVAYTVSAIVLMHV